MTLSRSKARVLALIAILVVMALQAFNSFACYEHNLLTFLGSLAFIAIPMLPALVAMATKNPLRSVGASLLFAPWLPFAYYTDCVQPYQGGGASMVYVVVVFYGFVTALVGAVLSGPVLSRLGVRVAAGEA